MIYSKEMLKEQIKAMGILPSDIVLIHTSMRAVGEVEGGRRRPYRCVSGLFAGWSVPGAYSYLGQCEQG